MPKLTKSHDSFRFNPAARFEAKPESDAMQALSIVYQQFNRQLADKPKLSLLESFKLNALLLKVHMTRSFGQEKSVMIYQSDIPSLQFAQEFSAFQLSPNMIKSMQNKGYELHVPPPSLDTHLAFICWDTFNVLKAEGWLVHERTGALEPLFIDAELRPNEQHEQDLQRLQISAP